VGIGAVLIGVGSSGVSVIVPWPTIGLAAVLGIALSMLAAAQPARMAGRMSIVAAVRGE
jgi:ABC-type antimicrobial peptide transport system permease subunit